MKRLLLIGLMALTACQDNTPTPSAPPNNTSNGSVLIAQYQWIDDDVINENGQHVSHGASPDGNLEIFDNNGTLFLKNLSYVIKSPFPITTTNSTISFQSCNIQNRPGTCINGTAYLLNDTLYLSYRNDYPANPPQAATFQNITSSFKKLP